MRLPTPRFPLQDLVQLYEKTTGNLHADGIVSFVGIVGLIISNFLILFLAGGLKHKQEEERIKRLSALEAKESKSDFI